MSREVRAIAGTGAIYALANVLGRSAGFILLPLYTHRLSVADYGLYTVLLSVIELGSLVFGMGMAGAMGRLYFDHPEGSPRRHAVVSTAVLGFAALALAVILAALAGRGLWAELVLGRPNARALFPATIAAVMLTILFEIAASYFIVRKEAWGFLWLSVAKFAALLGANLLLVVVFKLGVAGVVYAMVLGFGVVALPALGYILARVGLRFERATLRALFAFGLPLVPSAFAHTAMRFMERYVLTLFAGAASVAVYGLADRLVSVLQMFVAAPFAQVFVVRRFETLARGQDQREFETVLLVFVGVMCLAGLGLAILGREAIAVLAPPAYAGALKLIPPLVLAYILAALNVNIELGLLYAKRTHIVPLIGLAALAVAVPLNLALVPMLGALGAACASMITNGVRLVAVILCNRRWGTPQVRTDWARVAALLGTVGAVALLSVSGPLNTGAWGGLVARGLLWCVFLGLLLTSPLLDADTRRGLRALVGGRAPVPAPTP